jgi:hypothetical protein
VCRTTATTRLFDGDNRRAPSQRGNRRWWSDDGARSDGRRRRTGHPDDVEAAVTEYEQAMFVRSGAANAVVPGLHVMSGEGTPRSLINAFTGS